MIPFGMGDDANPYGKWEDFMNPFLESNLGFNRAWIQTWFQIEFRNGFWVFGNF